MQRSATKKFALIGPSHYNLVISDIRMPDMNGLQLYSKPKGDKPESKVNFVIALDIAQELTYLHIARFKGKDVIRRPIRRSKFIQTVEKNPQVNLNNNIL
jgi:CheY-like chemotaxis protein